VSVRAGRTKSFNVKLSKKARRQVLRAKRKRIRATLSGSSLRRVSARLTFVAPKRR
jgi:hypothetical protein